MQRSFLMPHYTKQITQLRIARMRILSKPMMRYSYIELEEISEALSDYKTRLQQERASLAFLLDTYPDPEYSDSKTYDL